MTERGGSGISWQVQQKYPLEALRSLRDAQADTRARALAEEEARLAAARAKLSAAEAALLAARQQAAASQRLERERLQAGTERASDLARAAAAERATAQRELSLQAGRDAAQRAMEATQRSRSAALGALARAREAADAVERHRGEFQHAEAQAAEQSEEDAALERWNSQHFAGRR